TSNVKQTVYTYDANGNQIKKTAEGKTETNTYNGLNQLIGFTDGETTASYKYNASGLRYEKTVDGQTINHVWDGNMQIVADVIDNQFYEADCYIRGTNLVAKYNYWNGDKSEYTYYTQNAHGDVVNLTDKDGKITKSYRYDAFGVEKNIDKNDTNSFRYCGEYYDKETATVYLRARNYNPSTGRFISRDSYLGKRSDPLSLNLYTYCRNNPISYIDPSGHDVLAAAEFVYYNPRPSSVNSAHDARLMNEWNNKYKKALNSSVIINSAGDAALYEKATSTLSFKVNSASDAKIIENQKKFYNSVKNSEYEKLTSSVMLANSIKPYRIPTGPPNSSEVRYDSNGNRIGVRYYGPDGKATKDIDETDHGNPAKHPIVPHEHEWGPERREDGKPVSESELFLPEFNNYGYSYNYNLLYPDGGNIFNSSYSSASGGFVITEVLCFAALLVLV
ncbi:MAG: RHS repeat-associated core domain-containing protein, partial [Oscillospiraceae bacterium]|nr:RHS repeat-associated core domain-containing protein [Oscillospiraceae bacterium]